jgi:nucleoid DNA-binding protein
MSGKSQTKPSSPAPKNAFLTKLDLIAEVPKAAEVRPKGSCHHCERHAGHHGARVATRGDKVEIRGFGNFRAPKRAAVRTQSQNRRSGGSAREKIPYFKPSRELRELLAKI